MQIKNLLLPDALPDKASAKAVMMTTVYCSRFTVYC